MASRRMTNLALAVVWGMALSGAVLAQQATLNTAVQQAVLSNPEVLQKWHAFQAAGNEKAAAAGGYLPRVDLSAGIGRENRDDPVMRRDFTRHGATLSLTQMLYDGFATRSEIRRLDHARQVRLFELVDASETAALEASRAYLDVLRYRKLVSLAEENYVRHRAVYEQIQKKAQAGVARRVDLEQAAGRLALAEANLLTETSNLHDVSARYQRLIGEMPAKDMAAAPPLAANLPADAAAAMLAVQARNPAIKAAIENVRAAHAAAEGRKAAYQPRLDLRLRNERGSDLNGYLGSTDNKTAEVVMTWNLFNGFSDQARARQYADLLDVARDVRDKTCRDVRQTAAIAYNDTRKLVEQLTYLDQHQLSTEKARDAYRKQFDIGQRSLLDLLDTENELFQARRAYVNAEHDLLIARARTHASQGTLLQALGLSRVARDEAPEPADWSAEGDAAERCPPEAPTLLAVDKQKLNERAAEFLRESQAAESAAGGAAARATAPAMAAPAVSAGAMAGAPGATPAGGGAAPAGVGDMELSEALKGWARAWSSRDLPAYLAFYAPDFQPQRGSRGFWESERKRIIGEAVQIKLDVSDVKVEMKDGGRAVTTFAQAYQSPIYRDVVIKTLEWRKTDGRWLIVREVPAVPPAMRPMSSRD